VPIDFDHGTRGRADDTLATPDSQGSPADSQGGPPDNQDGPPGNQGSPEIPGGRGLADRAAGAGLRQQQIAEHVRYRGVVDSAYQDAARQAWAKAITDLRGAWDEHREKFPQRSRPAPDTQPDGSWVADGHRRLTPEQNAEASKACADLRDEGSRVILPAMRRVESASPDGRLAGLDHMLKGEDRLKEKIADAIQAPGVTVREAIDLVPDAVRFTLTYDAGRYADGVLGDVDRLKAEGYELIKLKNLWHAEQYKGVNSQWRRPDTSLRLEVQFHTPESLEAKELTHEAYERIRGQAASSTEKLELEGFQRRVNALLAIPPGTDRIKDFSEQDDDRQSNLFRND
jgi:hypothetical protein